MISRTTSSTRLLLATLALTLAAGCSSSSEGSSGAGGDEGTGGQGTGGQGGGTSCGSEPLDCIGGSFSEDENGCLVCDYWECRPDVCPEGATPQCAGDDFVYCNDVEIECGVLDLSSPDVPACEGRYACVDARWTCECPTQVPENGAPCADVGQTCELPSDVDCGPPTVTVECTASGWARQAEGGAGGGGGGDGGVGGGDGCG